MISSPGPQHEVLIIADTPIAAARSRRSCAARGHGSGSTIQPSYADPCELLDSDGADRPPIRIRVHRHNTPAPRTLGSRIAA